MEPINNKHYESINLIASPQIFSSGYYKDYTILSKVATQFMKEIGLTAEVYQSLLNISTETADALLVSMMKKAKISGVSFLFDEESHTIIGYSLDDSRTPALNDDFMKRAKSIAEANDFIQVSETYYLPEDSTSSLIFKKKDPIVIEDKFIAGESKFTDYYIGILIVNDELTTTYTRLVMYLDGKPVYLPASYYNATASRYRRSTVSSSEALEVLLLKVIDDLRDAELYDKVYEFHHKYRATKKTVTSYEEYNTVLKTMRRIPTIIEDNSFLESLLSRYQNFERRYSHLEDQKSSYIWRCTALSDITIENLVFLTLDILSEVGAPSVEYFNIRDLLGSYISTNRIAAEIAKEDL